MPFMMAVVALIVKAVMAMMMARTGTAQERHRTIEKLFFRDSSVLVSVECFEQCFGTARRA
jgi:hypothetical protein